MTKIPDSEAGSETRVVLRPTSMENRFLGRRVAAAVAASVALVALTGCGDNPSTTEPNSAAGSDTTRASLPDPVSDVIRVVVSRSGGFAGVKDLSVFTSDGPPPDRYTKAQQEAVIAAATNPALDDVKLSKPNPCCDKFVYRIVVSSDGEPIHTFATADGETWPPAFAALMDAL